MNQAILQLVRSLSCGDFENFDGQVGSFAIINLRKACEIESNQLILCRE